MPDLALLSDLKRFMKMKKDSSAIPLTIRVSVAH